MITENKMTTTEMIEPILELYGDIFKTELKRNLQLLVVRAKEELLADLHQDFELKDSGENKKEKENGRANN